LQEEAEGKGRRISPHAPAEVNSSPFSTTGFGSYLFVHGAWFLTYGLQGVLFPYLVRVALKGSAGQLGIAQMCLSLPATFLILIGGLIADRVDVRRQITRLYTLSTIPYFLLGVLLITGGFSYPVMIVYALAVGATGAFTLPTRDALLARVAPSAEAGGIQRAVSLASLAQFSGQIIAMTIAAGSRFFGIVPLLFLQAGVMGGGAFLAGRLRPRAPPPKSDRGTGNLIAFALSELGAGMKAVIASRVIGALTLISFGVAATIVGSMQVLLPLLVQSYFPPDLPPDQQPRIASALAIFTLFFWLGTISAAMWLVRVGMPAHKGRAYLLAVVTSGAILCIEGIHMPFAVFCGLNYLWGISNGVNITIGRGVVQELAEEHLRARILSVFAFAFMAGGPIGAVAWGFLAGAIGPHNAILVPGSIAIVMALAAAVVTPLWHMTLPNRPQAMPAAETL